MLEKQEEEEEVKRRFAIVTCSHIVHKYQIKKKCIYLCKSGAIIAL